MRMSAVRSNARVAWKRDVIYAHASDLYSLPRDASRHAHSEIATNARAVQQLRPNAIKQCHDEVVRSAGWMCNSPCPEIGVQGDLPSRINASHRNRWNRNIRQPVNPTAWCRD